MIQGRTEIGENCTISPFASLGGPPQDISYKDDDTALIVGNNNVIKEYVTMNRGTKKGGGVTTVGDNNFIMAYVHIAHDCHGGEQYNNGKLCYPCRSCGGCRFSSFLLVFVLYISSAGLANYAFISGLTGVPKDVPPFMIAAGSRAKLYGLNVVGLERHGFPKEEISKLKKAYRILFRSALPLTESIKIIKEELAGEHINDLVGFIESSKRGICR